MMTKKGLRANQVEAPAVRETQYEALVACRNDATGKAYKPGDQVEAGDFEPDVIENWLRIGVLAKLPETGGRRDSREE